MSSLFWFSLGFVVGFAVFVNLVLVARLYKRFGF